MRLALKVVGIPFALMLGLVLIAGAITGGDGGCPPGGAPLPTTSGPPPAGAGAGDMVRYLESQDISANGSAGIVGNLSQESSLSPTLSGAGGSGLASWLPGWWATAAGWIVAHALNPQTSSAQLAYIVWELHGGDSYGQYLAGLNATASPQEAAVYFQNAYEACDGHGPAGTLSFDPAGACDTTQREAYAVQASQAAGGSTVVPVAFLSSACASPITDGSGADKLLAMAQAASGGPYSMPNHAAAFDQPAAWLKTNGTDCSGFVSWLLGPQGLGIWTTSYSTPDIPTAPQLLPGPGAQITLENNPGAGASGHVWIRIGSQYWESAGGIGIHQMDANEVAAYNATGVYSPFHPSGY